VDLTKSQNKKGNILFPVEVFGRLAGFKNLTMNMTLDIKFVPLAKV